MVPLEIPYIIMKVKYYTFTFTILFKYSHTMVDAFRVRMSKFVNGIFVDGRM